MKFCECQTVYIKPSFVDSFKTSLSDTLRAMVKTNLPTFAVHLSLYWIRVKTVKTHCFCGRRVKRFIHLKDNLRVTYAKSLVNPLKHIDRNRLHVTRPLPKDPWEEELHKQLRFFSVPQKEKFCLLYGPNINHGWHQKHSAVTTAIHHGDGGSSLKNVRGSMTAMTRRPNRSHRLTAKSFEFSRFQLETMCRKRPSFDEWPHVRQSRMDGL